MSIRIIHEPEIHITAGDLARYRSEYEKAFSYHCGPRPTLEEYIRNRQRDGEAYKSTL